MYVERMQDKHLIYKNPVNFENLKLLHIGRVALSVRKVEPASRVQIPA